MVVVIKKILKLRTQNTLTSVDRKSKNKQYLPMYLGEKNHLLFEQIIYHSVTAPYDELNAWHC